MKTLIQLQKSSKNGLGGFHFIDPDTRIRKLWDKRKYVCRQAIRQKMGYAKNDKKWDTQNTTKNGIRKIRQKMGYAKYDKKRDTQNTTKNGIRKKRQKMGYAKNDKKIRINLRMYKTR